MKDWLIKKLGGFKAEQVDETVKDWVNLVDKYNALLIDKNRILQAVKENLQQAQAELEHLKEWRNNVAETLRKNKVPRHIVNKIMEMKK